MTDGEVKGPKIDYFRDTPIRLLGYANEVGEAFRQLISQRFVRLSYAVASTYCLADATSKAVEIKQEIDPIDESKSLNRKAAEMFVEAAVWQGLASVIIPGFTINRICWISGIVLKKTITSFTSASQQKYLVTSIGLASIPFIIKPIDKFTDQIMEKGVQMTTGIGVRHEISHEEKFCVLLDKGSPHKLAVKTTNEDK